MRAIRQVLQRYRVVLIAVALASLSSLLFWSLGPRVPLGLFLAAVLVSAWQGGLRAAVLALVLATPVLALIARSQAPTSDDDLVLRLGLFVLVGLIAGYLSQQCRQAIRAVEHVHDVLGGSGIAIIAADTEGRVTSLNPLARTLTGRGEADAHGRPLTEVLRLVEGGTRKPVPLPPPGTGANLPDGTLLLGANGGETVVEGTIGPVRDGEGRPAGVMAVLREAGSRAHAVQELKQRAERFRALAGYAPAGLMVLDAEGRCVFCNPAAQSACGCSADECLGEGWSRHVLPPDRDRLISDWLRAVVARAPFADEFRVAAEAGEPRWLRLHSAPMLADGGEVLGHVAALEEMTEHRQAALALADARRESEEHLQEWAAAEKKAAESLRAEAIARQGTEEALRKVQAQLDERGTAMRRAEEALRAETAARQAAEEALDRARKETQERTAGQKRAHQQARAELEQRLQDETAARQLAEEELQRLRDEHAGHGDLLQSALAEKDTAAETLRRELARLENEAKATREAHDRLQGQLAERGGSEEVLRKEADRLAQEAATIKQAHDRVRAALEEKARQEEALRREREFLEGVIDGSPAGIFAHDEGGRCRVWNAALERLLNRPRSDALGRTEAELFPTAERSPHPVDAVPAPDGSLPADRTTVAVIGQSEFLESAHAAVRNTAGEVIGGMALVRVLPKPALLHDNGTARPMRRTPTASPAAARGEDADWLGFN
jgi:PAS domain S-box-containing protein